MKTFFGVLTCFQCFIRSRGKHVKGICGAIFGPSVRELWIHKTFLHLLLFVPCLKRIVSGMRARSHTPHSRTALFIWEESQWWALAKGVRWCCEKKNVGLVTCGLSAASGCTVWVFTQSRNAICDDLHTISLPTGKQIKPQYILWYLPEECLCHKRRKKSTTLMFQLWRGCQLIADELVNCHHSQGLVFH